MLISIATLALLTFFVGLAIYGVVLLRRGARVLGVALLIQAMLAAAAQVALSTIPVGIGNPLIRVPFAEVLAQVGASIVTIATVGGLVYLAGRWAGSGLRERGQRRLAAAGLLIALPALAASSLYSLVYFSTPDRERERDPGKRQITLPPGFQSSIFVQGTIDNPTTIVFGPDDKLYIADIGGTLWSAEDANNDGKAEKLLPFAEGFKLLLGLAWRGDEIYVASSGKIEALRDSDGDGKADQRRLLIDGLPSMVLMPHSNNNIVFGPDGRLYFGVGSTSSGQVEQQDKAAAVLSIKPDGSDLKVFARGFGNAFGLAFNSRGALFGGDNSPMGADADKLPDEFNQIVEGEHYGFPYFYGDPPKSALGTRGPVATFPPHSAPTGVSFYSGATYPREYYDNAFQTLWQRGEIARVEVGETTNGSYLSRVSTFASGFLYPIATVTGPDGNLYVADFGTSAVYRITYDAARASAEK